MANDPFARFRKGPAEAWNPRNPVEPETGFQEKSQKPLVKQRLSESGTLGTPVPPENREAGAHEGAPAENPNEIKSFSADWFMTENFDQRGTPGERSMPLSLAGVADAIAARRRSPFLDDLAISRAARAQVEVERTLATLPAHAGAKHLRQADMRMVEAVEAIRGSDYQTAYAVFDDLGALALSLRKVVSTQTE